MPQAAVFPVLDHGSSQECFRAALRDGLRRRRKAIPSRFLYDAAGSELFDLICEQPEYYIPNAELEVLRQRAEEVGRVTGPRVNLIELGAGSPEKAITVLRGLPRPAGYLPVDVSASALESSRRGVCEAFPGLEIRPVLGDFLAQPLPALPRHGRRLGFSPGSTIGNLEPREAEAFLRAWRQALGGDGLLLVGVDLKKSPVVIQAAYDDARGVTRAFITNILTRANREACGDFCPDHFTYRAEYTPVTGRMRMELESVRDQLVKVAGVTVAFEKGERLHIEDSWKYDVDEFRQLSEDAGFEAVNTWTDRAGLFSVHLLAAPSVADRVAA